MTPRLTAKLLSVIMLLATACTQKPTGLKADLLLPVTPVKSQGGKATCWAYAMLATIETEHILRGDSVHLSVAFVERAMEQEPAAPKSKRAMMPTLVSLIDRYGLVPFDAMPNDSLPLPRKAFLYGCEYTLQEFARSVCAPGEYIFLCTTDKAPYGQQVEPDVPDNWGHHKFLNTTPDELLNIASRALKHRHPVCWEGDTSERGFNWAEGYAVTSPFGGSTTDDHCMAIVGLGHDADGNSYFILKNSWGTNNRYSGLMFMSFEYFREKTIAIGMTNEALLCTKDSLFVQ